MRAETLSQKLDDIEPVQSQVLRLRDELQAQSENIRQMTLQMNQIQMIVQSMWTTHQKIYRT